MKKSEIKLSFTMPKFSYSEKDGETVREVKSFTQFAPLNVTDTEYFKNAVQYNIFRFGELSLYGKYYAEILKKDKTAAGRAKAEKLENEYTDFRKLFTEFKTDLGEVYEDVTEAVTVFKEDSFAKCFALYMTGITSYSAPNNDGGMDNVHIHVGNTSTHDARIHTYMDAFKDAEQEADAPEQAKKKKEATNNINALANEYFKTYGGTYYKKITYSLSQKLLNDELFTRSKKKLSANAKGGTKSTRLTPFEMCMQLFALCLYTQGIPLVDGTKTEYYETVGAKGEKTLATIKKKDRKPRSKKTEQNTVEVATK